MSNGVEPARTGGAEIDMVGPLTIDQSFGRRRRLATALLRKLRLLALSSLLLWSFQSTEIVHSAAARERHALSGATLVARAARGDPSAQTYLGYLYAKGRGVPQDYEEAVRWLTRAAEQGAPAAQFLLGLMYDKGHGAPQDFLAAYFWLDLAAARASAGRRGYWIRIRDAVALNLSLNELAEMQWRASRWAPLPE